MKVSLKLPLFGMNMEQATIVKWHKRPGERFEKGECLYEVETEKVTSEVEAPCDGVLREVVAHEEKPVDVALADLILLARTQIAQEMILDNEFFKYTYHKDLLELDCKRCHGPRAAR